MKRVHKAARQRQAMALIPAERIERAIHVVRGEKVMIDADLARLYRVPTKVLLQAVKRNAARFPPDFMLELTSHEADVLRSQTVTSNGRSSRGGRRYPPRAFTEQGVAMLSSVLRSERAVRVNVEVIRAFVRLRRMLATHADLARRLTELERKYDGKFRAVFDALRDLMAPCGVERPPRRIGFRPATDGHPGRDATAAASALRPRALNRVASGASPRVLAGCASTPPASRRRPRR